MLFNSIDFLVFLPLVFVGYWMLSNTKLVMQNILLLVASYLFYGWWDYRFLLLILFSTLLDFTIARVIALTKDAQQKKLLLFMSIVLNLGFLAFFKYYNFFIDSFVSVFPVLQRQGTFQTLNVILPVGISFYTFQTLSYTIDVYKGKIKPINNLVVFAVFVSFFPQLVAGPIERASNLLMQLNKKRIFKYTQIVKGFKQILWGFFKKMVIADNCATFVDYIFNGTELYGGSTMLIGAILFGVQIYADFSGYSDIAIGTANLFGVQLTKNFAFPYFSKTLAEFWQRWHITLFDWLRDYIYIPLGGNKDGAIKRIRNVLIVFLLSGIWHGANWTFVLWGLMNGLALIIEGFFRESRLFDLRNFSYSVNPLRYLYLIKAGFTFLLISLTWVMFRADNVSSALDTYAVIFSDSFFAIPFFPEWKRGLLLITLLVIFFGIEWLGRKDDFAIEKLGVNMPQIFRWLFYVFIFFLLGMYAEIEETPFIYFQF